MPLVAYTFGPFRIDLRAHRLLRDGAPTEVSAHLVDVLVYLAGRAGELVTREQLLDALWPGVFVTDNTVTRAVSDLRRALGDDPKGSRVIQTVARRGYRFVATVNGEHDDAPAAGAAGPRHDAASPRSPQAPAGDLELEALRDLVGSIPDLETFDLGRLAAARTRLQGAAARLPNYAPVHVALASAGALAFEASRASTRDRDALTDAIAHARLACELDPGLAEAWATLAFALTIEGADPEGARTAARRAVMIDGSGWRHHFRLAFASWGDERLRAVSRTLSLMPGMPFACLIGAMVHVARGARPAALDLLDQAAAGASPGAGESLRLPAAGLHWLRGAVLGASEDEASRREAVESARREIAAHVPGRLYSTEFAVNAWHWRAGWLFRQGNFDSATTALRAALRLDPSHARSAVALAALTKRRKTPDAAALRDRAAELLSTLQASGRGAEAAACAALRAVLHRDPDLALSTLDAMLAQAPIDHTGWTIPIDPWLTPLHGTPGHAGLLRRLAQRAV